MHAYCYASGEIMFGPKGPEGTIRIATGRAKRLRDAISPAARLAYDNKTLLVPGVPEADDQIQAGDALARWLDWRRKGWEENGLSVNPYTLAGAVSAN